MVLLQKCVNGSYNIDRANPALNGYNITLKNYTSVIKQLNDMLPKVEKKDSKLEEFKNF